MKTLRLIAHMMGTRLEFVELTEGRKYLRFTNLVEIKRGCGLEVAHSGFCKTEAEAVRELTERIRGQTLVVDAFRHRREYNIPDFI